MSMILPKVIEGEAGTGKTTLANKLKSQLQPHQYRVATPTHKSSLLYDNAQTIYSLFNIKLSSINIITHT